MDHLATQMVKYHLLFASSLCGLPASAACANSEGGTSCSSLPRRCLFRGLSNSPVPGWIGARAAAPAPRSPFGLLPSPEGFVPMLLLENVGLRHSSGFSV